MVDLRVPKDASRRDLSDATLRFDSAPRRLPSACAEKLPKNRSFKKTNFAYFRGSLDNNGGSREDTLREVGAITTWAITTWGS